MIKLLKTGTTIIFISILFSCFNKSSEISNENTLKSKHQLLDTLKWMIGNWENNFKDAILTETWRKKNDSVYVGIGNLVLNGKDTLFQELMEIQQQYNSLFYIVSVRNQNKGNSISFNLNSVTTNQIVFENKTHDYPTKIRYTKITKDSMNAAISGVIKGKEQTEYFSFKKIH